MTLGNGNLGIGKVDEGRLGGANSHADTGEWRTDVFGASGNFETTKGRTRESTGGVGEWEGEKPGINILLRARMLMITWSITQGPRALAAAPGETPHQNPAGLLVRCQALRSKGSEHCLGSQGCTIRRATPSRSAGPSSLLFF